VANCVGPYREVRSGKRRDVDQLQDRTINHRTHRFHVIECERWIRPAITLAIMHDADHRVVSLCDQPDLRLHDENTVRVIEHCVNPV
jgi:hypothetical protein